MPEPVVFWDIDGTIVSRSMESLFRRYLLTHGHVHRWRLPFSYAALLPTSRGKLHRLKLAYMRGMTISEVDRSMDDCFEHDIRPQLISDCTQAIARIKEEDIKQVLLSGTILGLAQRLGNFLGIDDIIAATPELIDGRYTGRLTRLHPFGRQKAEQAGNWLRLNNYQWSQTIAIADNIHDKHLLEKTSLPIVINPGHDLRAHARKMRWSIIDKKNGNMNTDAMVELVMNVRENPT